MIDFFTHLGNGDFFDALRNVPFDMASQSLSRQARYNGMTRHFYSVAQHCVLLSECWPVDDPRATWGLLHDFHECVIGDILKPVREILFWSLDGKIKGSNTVEEHLLEVVAERFGLDPIPDEVIEADRLIAIDEMRQLFRSPRVATWQSGLGIHIKPVSFSDARDAFRWRAVELGIEGATL